MYLLEICLVGFVNTLVQYNVCTLYNMCINQNGDGKESVSGRWSLLGS